MKILLTALTMLTTLTMLVLVSGGVSLASAAKLLNSTDSDIDHIDTYSGTEIEEKNNNHDNDKDKGIYACNVAKDTDKFCKENLDRNYKRQQDQFHHTPGISKITVGYGDVRSYYGKGKVVITNEDTGQVLVTHKLNFAKQHHNQGPDCCEKVYKFKSSLVGKGDDIRVKVTGGGGSWESGDWNWKKGLRISITLDEIGEDENGFPMKD